MTRIHWFLCWLFLLPMVASAQKGREYLTRPLPDNWMDNDAMFQQILPVEDHWWEVFEDATLDSLIDLAVEQNTDVLMALNRIEQARANLRIARSDYFPSLSLDGG